MSYPPWLDNLTEELGTARLKGAITRQEAVTKLRDAIDRSKERPLVLLVLAEFAGRRLDAWDRENRNPSAPAAVSSLQGELFPDLKPRLFVQPGVSKPVMTMTGHDWDNAFAMIQNRTGGAIDAAKANWKAFEDAYKRVRPLLHGTATTADVVSDLRGEVPLEGLAP